MPVLCFIEPKRPTFTLNDDVSAVCIGKGNFLVSVSKTFPN